MNSAKKKSFLVAVVCLILCVSLLIGTTFAWFSDSVSNTGNRIQAGSLKVALSQYNHSATEEKWIDISDSKVPVFNSGGTSGNLWEPGYSQYAVLKVSNEGNLSVNFKINIVNKTVSIPQNNICDVIDVYALTSVSASDVEKSASDIEAMLNNGTLTKRGTLSELMADPDGAAYGVLYAEEDSAKQQYKAAYSILVLKMQDTAGNDYKGLQADFDIILKAKQNTYEKDGFGSELYDQNAKYDGDTPGPAPASDPYITFLSENNFSLGTYENYGVHTDGSGLEYSTDALTWKEWNGSAVAAGFDQACSTYKIYLRGTDNHCLLGTVFSISSATPGISVKGNIMTLLDYENPDNAVMETRAFEYLFYGCSKLTDASGLVLPAATLTANCYSDMFNGCSNLTTAPALPANTLAEKCYNAMFYNCTNLTSAPVLPATTLASYCYSDMFKDCSGLTAAPALPATILADNCYVSMFSGCSNLTAAPALSAETLAKSCYAFMFNECSNLISAPALPASTLAEACYNGMFSGCTDLASAPALPAETLAESCYSEMFSGCSSLTSVPDLPAKTLADSCCTFMFSDCSSLISAPALPAKTLSDYCYLGMFSGCSNLTSAPVLPATTLAAQCYKEMFKNCTVLTTSPELKATTLCNSCYHSMFSGCSKLTTASVLPATTLVNACYSNMFYDCSSLKIDRSEGTEFVSIPDDPPNNAVKEMFGGTTCRGANVSETPGTGTYKYSANTSA